MTTPLDDDLLPVIFDLLEELGATMIVEEVTKTGDPTTGIVTEGTPTNHIVLAIPPFEATEGFAKGNVKRIGKMMTGVAGQDLPFVPVAGMKLTFTPEDTAVQEIWEITDVERVFSGNNVCLWLLFLDN